MLLSRKTGMKTEKEVLTRTERSRSHRVPLWGAWNGAVTVETLCWLLKELNIDLPYDPAIPLWYIPQTSKSQELNGYLTSTVQSSTIHSCQGVDATQISSHG